MTSKHTKLLNYMIGFCKSEPRWICPLGELKYKPAILEQSISMKDGSRVIPDVIFESDKQRHILVCECKGGTTFDKGQIARYQNLTASDLQRWIRLHTKEITHDVCYVMFESACRDTRSLPDTFPILTFSDYVRKHGKEFAQRSLEVKFSEAIYIGNCMPPLSYYRFSPEDDKHEIVPYVLRAIASILSKNSRTHTEKGILDYDRILRETHGMYELLSSKHKETLKSKIKTVVSELRSTYPTFKQFVEDKSPHLAKFATICDHILEEERQIRRVTDYAEQSTSD